MHVAVADGLLDVAVEAVVHHGLREHRSGIFGLRDLDELALASLVAVPDGRHHRERALGSSEVVARVDRGIGGRVGIVVAA